MTKQKYPSRLDPFFTPFLLIIGQQSFTRHVFPNFLNLWPKWTQAVLVLSSFSPHFWHYFSFFLCLSPLCLIPPFRWNLPSTILLSPLFYCERNSEKFYHLFILKRENLLNNCKLLAIFVLIHKFYNGDLGLCMENWNQGFSEEVLEMLT